MVRRRALRHPPRTSSEGPDTRVRSPPSAYRVHDRADPLPKRAVKATLIVAPTSILYQWYDEIRQHAPHLHVGIYEGARNGGNIDPAQACTQTVVASSAYGRALWRPQEADRSRRLAFAPFALSRAVSHRRPFAASPHSSWTQTLSWSRTMSCDPSFRLPDRRRTDHDGTCLNTSGQSPLSRAWASGACAWTKRK